MPIRVLVVDDSATARAVIKEALSSVPDIEVVAAVPDAYTARDKVVQLKPDVICLDVEMPRMDGITFLKKLMQYAPTPVVMVSSLTKKGAQITLEALSAGAVDFVTKPHANIYDGIDEIRNELIEKVRIASKAKVKRLEPTSMIKRTDTIALPETTKKVIAIGASTGGTEAIREILQAMPRDIPGIVIVQHMPPNFTATFAERLNGLCDIEVKKAKNGEYVEIGKALIANGAYHMALRRSGARYFVEYGDGEKVSGHKPSVDVLFNSVAKNAGANAIGVILTGMGADGARGLLEMRKAGARTIGQDEKSSVVYGMPKVAFELGAVEKQLPLSKIADEIINLILEMK